MCVDVPEPVYEPNLIERWLAYPCIWLILAYRVTLSPFLGGQCRFEPTCSLYALTAFERFGARWGSWLTLKRLLRCQPLCKRGYDPVPWGSPNAKLNLHSPAWGEGKQRGSR